MMDQSMYSNWDTSTDNGHDDLLHQHESPFSLNTPVVENEFVTAPAIDAYIERESPFFNPLTTATAEGESFGPQEQAFVQFLDEIQEDEFSEAIVDLANEAERYLAEHVSSQHTSNQLRDAQMEEEVLTNHFQPLAVASENLMDHLMRDFAKLDQETLTEGQIDDIFERYESNHSLGNPVFEEFLKKLWKKAKKAAKGVAKVVKKGINIVKKLNPMNLVLGRLKKMARGLLGKIVRKVINRLPQMLRNPARMLARKLGISAELELNEMEEAELMVEDQEFDLSPVLPPASADLEILEQEFNLRLAEQTFANTEEEADQILAAYNDTRQDLQDREAEARFEHARERLIEALQTAQSPEEVRPHVEEFVGTALMVLRWGIRIIGRKRVINFISGLFTKLIARLIGKKYAAPLARTLVSKGFSLLNLEVSEHEADTAAAESIAQVLEEITYHTTGLSAEVLNDQELLEQEIVEQFSALVAQNFPSDMVQEELRESEVGAAWVLLPRRGRRRYKKYSRVLEVNLDRAKVRGIKTFGGQYLQSFLRRRHQLGGSYKVRVKVHIYQAIRGTTLSHISLLERNVRGLGSSRRSAWSQIHPLTPQVAGQLLGNPRLGSRVAARWLSNRNRIQVGQRFYYLELVSQAAGTPPAPVRPQPPRPVLPGIPSGVTKDDAYVKLDFTRSTMTLALMMTEAKAAEVTRRIKANDYLGAATTFRTSIRDALNNILLKDIGRHVKVVMELSEDQYLEDFLGKLLKAGGRIVGGAAKEGLKMAVKKIIQRLVKLAEKALANHLRRLRNDFIRAQENGAQGLTLHLVFVDMPGMALIRTLFKLKQGRPVSVGDVTGTVIPAIPTPDLRIFPGRKSL
ncbi:hypothetical protein [Lewinella sp. W8]|uniref:hypothetical protein n=1 Tax=Lewinella sp. W8 TaxID=2528208 RepID=UPI001067C58B|nr:hypothetical protein [Lewinella sp. W8]MTB51143.1 hypothetical protein [Lewinella sp. W8]